VIKLALRDLNAKNTKLAKSVKILKTRNFRQKMQKNIKIEQFSLKNAKNNPKIPFNQHSAPLK